MLVNKYGYLINPKFKNYNWTNNPEYFIIDETTVEGQIMARVFVENHPFVDFTYEEKTIFFKNQPIINEDGKLEEIPDTPYTWKFVTSVTELEKSPEVKGKKIELIINEQGEWEHIYVDIPLADIEILKQENKLLKAQIQSNSEISDFHEELLFELAMMVYP